MPKIQTSTITNEISSPPTQSYSALTGLRGSSNKLNTMTNHPLALITGTTGGIGNELAKYIASKSIRGIHHIVHCGNRRMTECHENSYYCNLDMGNKQSIDDFITAYSACKYNIIILNAGVKPTRRRVEWDGHQINQCRAINLVGNRYLMDQMLNHDMITDDASIVLMTSIMHWDAESDPNHEMDCGNDSVDPTLANSHYPNTKMGLFFLADYIRDRILNMSVDETMFISDTSIMKSEPSVPRILLVNPGLVSTGIFGDLKDGYVMGFFEKIGKYIREELAISPKISVDHIVAAINHGWIENDLDCGAKEEDDASSSPSSHPEYYTPYIAVGALQLTKSLNMVQDVVGKYMLPKQYGPTQNYNIELYNDSSVRANYMKYMVPPKL